MYRIDTGQARTDLYQNNPLEFTELQKGVAESRKRLDEAKAACGRHCGFNPRMLEILTIAPPPLFALSKACDIQ